MTPRALLPFALCLLAGCPVDPKPGTNVGALRNPPPPPEPPVDTADLDMKAAVELALHIGGLTTLNAAWTGQMAVLDSAEPTCPTVWLGPLPEGFDVDIDLDEDTRGMSWAAAGCTTGSNRTYNGFTHWSSTLTPGAGGTRTLIADAEVLDGDGTPLFAFDGEATDAVDLIAGTYTSTLDGELDGALIGLESGFRTGAEFEASWSTDGTLLFNGTMSALEGFGPPDGRDGSEPELEHVPTWEPNMPRFTSVRFDLAFTPECRDEPVGYIGVRGNEGFWFDVYFLRKPDLEEASAQANAFPYEDPAVNNTCDGIGTLFARNVDLASLEAQNDGWSRSVSPDFGSAIAGLPMPDLADFVYTVRDIPTEE